jgi:RimJ/RimL family protein N-acetyltransferase
MIGLQFQYKFGNIGFKPLTEEDLKTSNYINWFSDPQVIKYNSHGVFGLNGSDIKEFFESIYRKERVVFAIYHLAKEKTCFHIGNISLQSFDWINRSCEFAILIGEPDFYKKGIGSISTMTAMTHAFNRMGFNRIWAGASSYNIGMQKVFEFFGWKKEGVHREAKLHEGGMVDVYQYSILAKEFKETNSELFQKLLLKYKPDGGENAQ